MTRRAAHRKISCKRHTVLAVLILCLVVTYVWQINNQAEQSFVIKDLEEEVARLEDIVRDRQLEVSGARSLSEIAERSAVLELKNPQEVSFIKIGLNAIAVEYDKEQD